MKYKRILLKLSGEALAGHTDGLYDQAFLAAVAKEIRTCLDACKNGTPAPVPTSQIIYNQAIIDGIARSAECGHEVEINVPEV